MGDPVFRCFLRFQKPEVNEAEDAPDEGADVDGGDALGKGGSDQNEDGAQKERQHLALVVAAESYYVSQAFEKISEDQSQEEAKPRETQVAGDLQKFVVHGVGAEDAGTLDVE